MEEIEVGMTVRLHSGGPILTVNAQPDEAGYVTCVWFDNDKHVESYAFHMSSLELANTDESAIGDEADETTDNKIEDDVFPEHNDYERDDDLYHEEGCGDGYSCEECENAGCPAHPCN